MDNHPIPQDVTHFQFKLIGQLTIKQFAYLIAGGVLALIAFALPIHVLIKTPLVLIFGGLGLLMAFIPIEGRPADLMANYFFRALFEPNQYIYSKQGATLLYLKPTTDLTSPPLPEDANKNLSSIYTTPRSGANILLDMELSQSKTGTPATAIPTQSPQPVQQNAINSTPESPIVPPASQPTQQTATEPPAPHTPQGSSSTMQAQPQNQIATAAVSSAPQPSPQSSELEKQLQQSLAEKEQLRQQLEQMQEQLTKISATKPAPDSQPAEHRKVVSPIVKQIAPTPQTKSSLIAPDFPNIVMGIVKDARGNVLPNILIEVKDTNNNPVRAFKTNALGQFASATPLLNGTYTVVFEDPAKVHSFDSLEILAKGEIMQPIEIISLDKREELRKELFG